MAIDFNILYINGTPEEKKALSIASSQLCSYTDICHSCIEAAEFREDIIKGDYSTAEKTAESREVYLNEVVIPVAKSLSFEK